MDPHLTLFNDPIHQAWFQHQAAVMKHLPHASPDVKDRLQMVVLHAFSKVASLSNKDAKAAGFYTSPFLPEDERYHRNSRNELISTIDEVYAKDLGLKPHEVHVVSGPLLLDTLKREYTVIDRLEELKELSSTSGRVLFVYTGKLDGIADFEQEVIKQIPPEVLPKFHLIAFHTHRGESLLLTPEFLLEPKECFDDAQNGLLSERTVTNRHGVFDRELYALISRNGFRLSPIEAKLAWLKVDGLETILKKTNIPLPASAAEKPVTAQCETFDQFISHPLFKAFRNLSGRAPYLTILSQVAVRLLEGFTPLKIDAVYKRLGIGDLVKISYAHILDAMKEAMMQKDTFVRFHNQLEVIHQEIQDMLAVVEPYASDEFSKTVTERMQLPFLPKVHLKASAMHAFSSILTSMEALKGNNNLKVAVLDKSYYHQSDKNLESATTYSVWVVDSELKTLPEKPIDLFITEFHHNIQTQAQSYKPEDVLNQVKSLYKKGLLAEKCTILLDTTIDLEHSNDVQHFLSDRLIQSLLQEGKLNVVMLRSAQKYDMFGMDNYYGGIAIAVHSPHAFAAFDAKMATPGDELKGLSFQGLAHIQKHCGDYLDTYRLAIMKNARTLYSKLPRKMIYNRKSTYPIQISQLKDERLFFLDIKFPGYPKTREACKRALKLFAHQHGLPFASRPSFGFSNTTMTVIDQVNMRLNVGLEDKQTLDVYAQFFKIIRNTIGKERQDAAIASQISTLFSSTHDISKNMEQLTIKE